MIKNNQHRDSPAHSLLIAVEIERLKSNNDDDDGGDKTSLFPGSFAVTNLAQKGQDITSFRDQEA